STLSCDWCQPTRRPPNAPRQGCAARRRQQARSSVARASDVRIRQMNRIAASIIPLIAVALATPPALAQTRSSANQAPSSHYPAPPPEKAPTVQQGAPLNDLSSPLPAGAPKVERTDVVSESEAQLFADAHKIMWGRYAKVKGVKPGEMTVSRQG